MKKLVSALPFVGIGIAMLMLPFLNEPNKTDPQARQAINALQTQVAQIPAAPVSIGSPPDTNWVSDRVIELPEDGSQWQTVLVVDQSAASAHLLKQFNETPRLRDLWSQTKHYTFSATDPWVKKNRTGYPLPLVLIQRPTDPNGSNQWERVYECWGSGIPGSGEQIANDISEMIANSVRRRPCPTPNPTPTPSPTPQPTPVQPMVPLTPDSDPAKPEDDISLIVYLLVAAAGAGAGAWANFKRTG